MEVKVPHAEYGTDSVHNTRRIAFFLYAGLYQSLERILNFFHFNHVGGLVCQLHTWAGPTSA